MSLNFFAIPPLLTGLMLFLLGIFVYVKRHTSNVSSSLALFCFSLSWWLLAYSMMYLSEAPSTALFWARFGCMAIVLIPVFTFHFIVRFLKKRAPFITKFFYYVAFILLPLVWSPFVYQGIRKHYWGYYPVAGPFYWVLLTAFVTTFMTGAGYLLAELIASSKTANHRHFNQVKFVFIGILIGCFGVVDYVIKYGIEIYPFGYIAALIFATAIVYAIFRHKLLDIDVILKKTVVFAGLFTVIMMVVALVTIITQGYIGHYFSINRNVSTMLSVIIAIFLYDPVRVGLVNLTDKFLFQKAYDYQKFLKDASQGISKIESLERLMKLVVHFITMKMRVRNAAILTRSKKDKDYLLKYRRGYAEDYVEYRFAVSSSLITFLEREKQAVDLDRLLVVMDSRKKEDVELAAAYNLQEIKKQMEEMRAVCCVPSFLGHELKNILILGEKKSGNFYTTEDLNVLYTLAQESAIAIENARLYDEAITKTHELEKINRQLEYSKGLLVKALKETEVANKQLQDTQAQLIHEQKMATLGRLAASVGHEVNNPLTILSMNVSRAVLKYRKNPETKVAEIVELFDKMEQNIGRIKAVVNTLTGLLKRSEKGKFEPLSLKLVLEETLPLVQFQTYLDNLTGTQVDFDIPGNIPLIRGDLERLQEVFLNLFINAYHAMEGRRNRRIHVTAEIDMQNPGYLAVHFTDNGKGMSEEVMKKVFNYGYTTKPVGRGSGMGLYMCKYIIELHGGNMHVASKEGIGTTFTLALPIYEESGSSAADAVFRTSG